MNLKNLVTDSYERKARLYPALLLIAPVVAAGAAHFSTELAAFQSLIFGIIICGGTFLLAQLARDPGKRKEKDLFQKWGGIPSVTIFRHRDQRLDPITKGRYHKQLARLVKKTKAPTPEQEEADPINADTVYAAWSNYLRTNTRDSKTFGLLSQENINYGYRRNAWGLRPIGITLSVVLLLTTTLWNYLIHRSTSQLNEPLLAAGTFSLILLVFWLFRVSEDWVKVPADAYAERLAESVEVLSKRLKNKK